MAKTTKSRSATARRVDLANLAQGDVAWLLNRPASWVRDKAHLFTKNVDGAYSGQQVVEALQSQLLPAELDDQHLEGATQLAEIFTSEHETTRRGAIRILAEIEAAHGAAGLAAVASLFLATLREWLEEFGDSPHARKPTADEIRARAKREIAALPKWEAELDLRVVFQCPGCRRYRWGQEWRKPPIPTDYVAQGSPCPKCEAKTEVKR